MPMLPIFLKRFQPFVKGDVSHDFVKNVEFSRGTYQVLISDPKTSQEIWVFLQLDQHGRLKDSFCSCENHEGEVGCVHQAIAFMFLYGNHPLPLHIRFQRSLWNHLCQFVASELSDFSSDCFDHSRKEEYHCYDDNGTPLFSMVNLSPTMIKELGKLLFDREVPTEETSLKFSNLSLEELSLWQRGKPSPQLAYELSVWSDLAKYFLKLQESQSPYTLTFHVAKNGLPDRIKIVFPEITLEWALSEACLLEIIPSLSTVASPLQVHYKSTTGIEKISYDKNHRCFVPFQAGEAQEVKGISLGDWTYVVNDGFYSETHHSLLSAADLSDVETVLNEHFETMRALLAGCKLHETPLTLSYWLSFDEKKNLHIQSYLMTPGDVTKSGSHFFGSWAYLDGQGFYRITGKYFDDVVMQIPFGEVSDFIGRHRVWLNTVNGFSTHITPIEAGLNYQLSRDNVLSFKRSQAKHEHVDSIDFNAWIYVPGQGFFAKTSLQTNLPLDSSTVIIASQIAMFIRRNRDELQLVQGFFSHRCPVVKSFLNIYFTPLKQIQVVPEYELMSDYQDKDVRFFDDFVYVESEGFHELPTSLRLPLKFSSAVTIDGSDIVPFIKNELDALLPITQFVDSRLKRLDGHLSIKNLTSSDDSEKHHYIMELKYRTDLGSLSISALWEALQRGEKYVCSEAGLIDLDEKQFEWLKLLGKRQVNKRKETVELSSLEVLRLHASQDITVNADPLIKNLSAFTMLSELIELRLPEDPDYTGLASQLRPYQILGVRWLWFLYHHGLSGLLCDDMGLGKTHQAMALLIASINHRNLQPGCVKGHSLVICPTSVIYHWQEKINQFLPHLHVITFHGNHRSLEGFHENCDVLLTSYGVWRNEIEKLSKLKFDVAIFDELQIAKNQSSRIYKTLVKVKAKMRLGMTGTPIENYLRELKSLFDLVLPSYFPGDVEFRRSFINPIERENNRERKLLLSRLIKPFIMRRKKGDVLLDLPEKTEEVVHCDLSDEQRLLYEKVLATARDRLLSDLSDEANPIPYIHVFALLAHLKQICNHPAIYLKQPENYKDYQSGKWDLFIELLEEARESGQKVVIFSQYLGMLDIIESYLHEHQIGYATIRGSTVNRGEQLKRFNSDPTCEVFVASLQAAGLGIDLTAASVVIHYDRWWNAARENQATDRVHRIGQTRGVQVLKLVTKGTLEEHIDLMIAKKGRLMEDIIGVDDHEVIKQFNRQEMISLLQMQG